MLSFALAFWKKEVPEEVSRTEKLSIESPARAVSHCAWGSLEEAFPPSRHKKNFLQGCPSDIFQPSDDCIFVVEFLMDF